MPCWHKDFLLSRGRGIYPQIFIEFHALQCLIVRGSSKQEERYDYFKFHKRRDFFVSYDNQVLLRVISQCGHSSCTLQEKRSYLLQFGWEENIPGYSNERRGYRFILKITRVFPISTGKVGDGWWTLLLYYIILTLP